MTPRDPRVEVLARDADTLPEFVRAVLYGCPVRPSVRAAVELAAEQRGWHLHRAHRARGQR